ncbi:MAG: hypothetical protein RBU30_11880 [Polyangia bacterium]|jgi:hypothetical protein|nr:hypothetical protein [Polyangia bacterium]
MTDAPEQPTEPQEAQEPAPEPGEAPTTLESIERLGSLQMKPNEVQLVLGLEPWEDGSDQWKAYHKGRLQAVAQVRDAMRRSALQGSAPSQAKFLETAERVDRLPPPAPKPAPQPDPPRRRR